MRFGSGHRKLIAIALKGGTTAVDLNQSAQYMLFDAKKDFIKLAELSPL